MKIAGPTTEFAVDPPNQHLDVLPSLPSFSQLIDLVAEPVYLLPRQTWSQIGLAHSAAIVSTLGVAQKVKRFLRQRAEPRLALVHRQFQRGHHLPHQGHGLFSRTATAVDEIVRVVDDASGESLLVSSRFPSLHKSSHVDVGQHR